MVDWADIALGAQQGSPGGGNSNLLGISRGSKNYADRTFAAITRANWDHARPQLESLLDRLQYTYTNPQGRQEAIQQGAQLATQGVEQARDDFMRQAKSTGLSLAPDQMAAVNERFDRQASVSKIDAMNRASRGYDDLKNKIALG